VVVNTLLATAVAAAALNGASFVTSHYPSPIAITPWRPTVGATRFVIMERWTCDNTRMGGDFFFTLNLMILEIMTMERKIGDLS
jgi:hypothetical protein